MVAYRRGSTAFFETAASSKFKDEPGLGMAARGTLLIQDHGNEVTYRSLKIRELK